MIEPFLLQQGLGFGDQFGKYLFQFLGNESMLVAIRQVQLARFTTLTIGIGRGTELHDSIHGVHLSGDVFLQLTVRTVENGAGHVDVTVKKTGKCSSTGTGSRIDAECIVRGSCFQECTVSIAIILLQDAEVPKQGSGYTSADFGKIGEGFVAFVEKLRLESGLPGEAPNTDPSIFIGGGNDDVIVFT